MIAIETATTDVACAEPAPTLEIVVPVHNEEADLEQSLTRLLAYLAQLPFSFRVTIADNASTDATALVARRLAHEHPEVAVVRLRLKGRGRALKHVWLRSLSPVLMYMDVDLSTDLNALLPLVAPLISGHSDLAIGTRLTRTSRVERGAKREVISRCYNLLLRGALRTRFTDAQCGFKAIRREVARELLPFVEDDGWFFDTELLVLAERAGLRIHEVAVDWVDDADSRVDIVGTAAADIRGIARLGWSLLRGQVPLAQVQRTLGRGRRAGSLGAQSVMFALIGIASTVGFAVLFLALRTRLDAPLASAAALLLTTVANTAANRRVTFGIVGPERRWRHQAQGLLVLGAGLIATSGALWVVERLAGPAHPALELAVLTLANLTVTVVRFVAMRGWMFRRREPDRAEAYPAPSGPGSAPLAHDHA